MGKKYSDASGFAPTAQLKVKDAMMKGTLLGKREVVTQYGPRPVFSFKVLDADCVFTLGKGEEVVPEEGATVDVFGTTRLSAQLNKVPFGETVTIRYLGLGKGKGPNKPHTFEVEGE